MIDFVLTCEAGKESAADLANAIEELQGKRCRLTFGGNSGRFVRYGSTRSMEGECLNSQAAVKLASNKLAALLVMGDAGVRTPKLFAFEEPVGKVVWRKSARYGGRDCPLITEAGGSSCDSAATADAYDYALEWVDKIAEYRVHVVLGEAIRVQKRRPCYGSRMEIGGNSVCTAAKGWTLEETEPPFSWLPWLAIKATEALGLDFGAVDIVQGRWGLYVLEINTAPGIIPNGVEKYARAFLSW